MTNGGEDFLNASQISHYNMCSCANQHSKSRDRGSVFGEMLMEHNLVDKPLQFSM